MKRKVIVGIDEAGRGPLSGPVVAAAVMVLDSKFFVRGLKDSKKLSAKRREEIFEIIKNHPRIKWGIGRVGHRVIDKINIKNAAELAMEKSSRSLEKKIGKRADLLIIDGNHINNPKLKTKNHKLVVKADEKVFECMLASIIAKVTRDRIMRKYDKKYPQYGFIKHKGYPTKKHVLALRKYGPCKIHRLTFTPVKAYMVK